MMDEVSTQVAADDHVIIIVLLLYYINRRTLLFSPLTKRSTVLFYRNGFSQVSGHVYITSPFNPYMIRK